MTTWQDEEDAKHGVRSGRKRMGQLTIPSENAGRETEASSKRSLRRKVREPTLGDLIRRDILEMEEK